MSKKIWILGLIMSVLFVGCQQKEPEVEAIYLFEYYYIDSCSRCVDFKENGIPLIEKEFGSEIEIVLYDMDDIAVAEQYDSVLDRIIGFNDEDDYGFVPFLSFDGYFAKLGIYYGEYEELVSDMRRAVNGEALGEELSNDRYLFKSE